MTFTAPGRGRWSLERSHFGGVFTVAYRDVYQRGQHDGMKASMARYGAAGSHLAVEFLNDRPYTRLIPLVEPPGKGTRTPPASLVWLLARLHPRFRKRNRAAKQMLSGRLWREDGRRWYEHQKPEVIRRNLALQDEPIESYDAGELAAHLKRVVNNAYRGVRAHFELVGPDAFPVGDFLVHVADLGVDVKSGLALMAGASPASADSAALLEPAARTVRGTTRRVASLDDVRALGATAAAALDVYLRNYGWRAVANYDVDGPTVGEMPHLVVNVITSLASRPPAAATSVDVMPAEWSVIRERLSKSQRTPFDDLLAEARFAYGIRDDNAGPTLQWTVGLFRRALLECGRRLVEAGRLTRREDTFELQPSETAALVRGEPGPSRDEVDARAARRRANNALDAPRTIGAAEALPPLAPLPAPLRRVAASLLIQVDHLYSDDGHAPLTGSGVGTEVVRGRACVARSAEDAFDRLQPGDVLVTTMTTPAYDAVLPILAGLVVEEGGMLSHAAIVAREFGLPAVIGASGALDQISDGDDVEIDPVAGTVRVV